MEQCFGLIGRLFGNRRRKRRLKYSVNYKDGDDRNLGVEFENLMLEGGNQQSYGTNMQFITSEEREYVTKRQYDRIIEEQRKVDEQIGKKLFDDEELLRVEEDAYYEAQREAAKAASRTLSLKEKSSSLVNSTDSGSHNSPTLEEVEDDFEDFLEEVRNRSIAFRNQYASKDAGLPEETVLYASLDRGGDGQSSDEDYVIAEKQSGDQADKVEWDSYTSGINHLPPENLRDKNTPLEKRLDPVGVGGGDNRASSKRDLVAKKADTADKRLEQAERMFSITDDEDMGDYVHA